MCGTASFHVVYVLFFLIQSEKPSSWLQKTYLLKKSNHFPFACYFKPNVDVALCCFINKLLFSATRYWKWHRTCRVGTVPLWQMGRVWACQPTIPHITQQSMKGSIFVQDCHCGIQCMQGLKFRKCARTGPSHRMIKSLKIAWVLGSAGFVLFRFFLWFCWSHLMGSAKRILPWTHISPWWII